LKKKNKIRNEKNDANPWLNKISVEYSIDKIDVLTAGYFTMEISLLNQLFLREALVVD